MSDKVNIEKRLPDYWKMRKSMGNGIVNTNLTPDWWLSGSEEVVDALEKMDGVRVFEFGESAGGLPLIAASLGEREDLPGRTSRSLASAIAGGSSDAFYGKGDRKHQGFCFIGAAHGIEIEGTVAMLNLMNVAVTGRDFRGQEWPALAKYAANTRIVFIPFLNIDGRRRFDKCRHFINVHPDDYHLINQGRTLSGETLRHPESKLIWPQPVDKRDILGSYHNDNGVNLVYDHGMNGDPQPETKALLQLLKDEMPDCALLSHSNSGTLVCDHGYYIPDHFKVRLAQLSSLVGERCRREKMSRHSIWGHVLPYSGQMFYQSDMVYHVCGALPLLVEFPIGYQNIPDNFDEILNTGLFALEEILMFGNERGFRPHDNYQSKF